MAVTLHLDARQVKKEVDDILKMKIRGITVDNGEVRDQMLHELKGYIRAYAYAAGYDTGALSEQTKGRLPQNSYTTDATNGKKSKYISPSPYPRYGSLDIGSAHNLVWDAWEDRGYEHHYIQPVMARVFGVPTEEFSGQTIIDAMHKNGDWKNYLEACKEYLKKVLK